MKIKRVEHIAIAVNSLRQSMDLLQNTFGIPLEYEEQIGATRLAMLPVGETYIELLESSAPDSGINQWIAEKGETIMFGNHDEFAFMRTLSRLWKEWKANQRE